MKSTLHNFFNISPVILKNKKYFIYDQENKKAYFDTIVKNTDVFINTKSSVQLYYRKSKKKLNEEIDISVIAIKCNDIPLLKSNLQKAIRRCKKEIAVYSAIALIILDPLHFLRRLAIIYIEDVCLMDSYPLIIWFMMAENDYTLTSYDIESLLKVVMKLSLCSHVYTPNENIEDSVNCREITHELLQNHSHCNELLALYYRLQYGGMSGDMKMLKTAIYYYITNPHKIQPMVYDDEPIQMLRKIMAESIDFHPYPHLLSIVEKQTGIEKEIIKEYI
jgi:hypothetical protein